MVDRPEVRARGELDGGSGNARAPWWFLVATAAAWVPLTALGDAPLGLPVNLPLAALATTCPMIVALLLILGHDGVRGWGPFLAAIAVLRGAGRRGALTVALGLLPGCLAVSAVVTLCTRPVAAPDPSSLLATVPLIAGLSLLAAMAEEAGWTAYLLEPLSDRIGCIGAATVIGVVSAVLHLPGWAVLTHHGWGGFTLGMALATVGLRFVAVWLWKVTGNGVGAPVLLHASINTCSLPFAAYDDPLVVAALTGPVAVWCARNLKGSGSAQWERSVVRRR